MIEKIGSSVTAEEMVRNTFSRSTESYSRRFLQQRTGTSYCFRRRLELSVELAGGSAGRMLDCATGTGEITAAVLNNGKFTHATIVDISQEMLARARAHIEGTANGQTVSRRFVSKDIFDFLPAASPESYELVLCLGLIAHTGRLGELLAAIKPLLSSGGRILLQTTLLDHLGTRVVRALTEERYFRNHGYRIHYFRARDVEEACRRNGLFVHDVRRFALGVPFGDKAWASGNYWLESALQGWAAHHGSEAIYVISNRPW